VLRVALVLAVAFVPTRVAYPQAYSVLYSFAGSPDGAFPTAALVSDSKGTLYGTTFFGGRGACGCGTVFTLTKTGTEKVLYSFMGGADGADPYAGLIRDASGSLYGTTIQGGDLGCANPGGCGTVFRVDARGTESVLHAFAAGTDGQFPYAGLLGDAAGNFYGTTVNGGHRSSNFGIVFKIDSTGKETVLHRFTGGKDGAFPFGTLMAQSGGRLYGTTSMFGGAGGGTVFGLTATGILTTVNSFAGSTGESPLAGLVGDEAGNFYGTTSAGGGSGCGGSGCGTVFVVDRAGKEKVLHHFRGGSDGAFPYSILIRDLAGNLYGTTWEGGGSGCGGSGCGTVFKLNKYGKETLLYSFTGGTDGGTPYAGLIRDAAGNLYGTASSGGATGNGVVFKLSGLP
jgi:uncharacterized repeat protein (TIGR03803 family)